MAVNVDGLIVVMTGVQGQHMDVRRRWSTTSCQYRPALSFILFSKRTDSQNAGNWVSRTAKASAFEVFRLVCCQHREGL